MQSDSDAEVSRARAGLSIPSRVVVGATVHDRYESLAAGRDVMVVEGPDPGNGPSHPPR